MSATSASTPTGLKSNEQLTTFFVDGSMFGIEVLSVQEVAKAPTVFNVPLAPKFVLGLVNLRGQIAMALGLRELLGSPSQALDDRMSVVCKLEGHLVALIVDSIGDVVEVEASKFEETPDTIPFNVRRFIKGIYKMNGVLLSVLDLDALAKEMPQAVESGIGKSP